MATSELYEEVGRLKQRVEYLGEEVIGLREKNETLDEANMTMHEELAKANRALKREATERGRLQDDIRRLNEELEAQNEEIEKLHDQLAKAQRTIKVQSDQIAAPADKKSRRTSSSRAVPSSRPNVEYSRTPPAFQLPQRRPFSVHPQQHMSQSGYLPPQPAQSKSYHRHSPPPSSSSMLQSTTLPLRRPSITPPPPHHQHEQQNREHQYQHTTTPVRQIGIALPLTEGEPNPTIGGPSGRAVQLPGWPGGGIEVNKFLTVPSGTIEDTRREEGLMSLLPDLSPLFFLGETWARRYCGVPSKTRDAAMPPALKDRIASLTNSLEVQTLLSHGFSRPLVVAKIINHEVTTTCLRPSVIDSFRPSIDQKLEGIRKENTSIVAINVRRGILAAAAEIIQEATEDPRFESWVERRADQNTAITWTTIGPLCVSNTVETEAKVRLKAIWLKAYRVGVKMACKPSIFTTEFPPTGPQSVFNPAIMVNKDYANGVSGTELARRRCTVRLAVTPVVMETDFSGRDGSERLEPRCLHFSNCLLTYN